MSIKEEIQAIKIELMRLTTLLEAHCCEHKSKYNWLTMLIQWGALGAALTALLLK